MPQRSAAATLLASVSAPGALLSADHSDALSHVRQTPKLFDQAVEDAVGLTHLTLPYHEYLPPKLQQRPAIAAIAFDVSENFLAPELLSDLRPYRVRATMMMPEAPVHEYDSLTRPKNQIGFAWKAPVEPVTEACRVKRPANSYLRTGIFAADRRHVSASCGSHPPSRQPPIPAGPEEQAETLLGGEREEPSVSRSLRRQGLLRSCRTAGRPECRKPGSPSA